MYLGICKKMHLPSTCPRHGRSHKKAGNVAYLYCQDVARIYCQLQLDPADWPLVCFVIDSKYYADISLPFGLRLGKAWQLVWWLYISKLKTSICSHISTTLRGLLTTLPLTTLALTYFTIYVHVYQGIYLVTLT